MAVLVMKKAVIEAKPPAATATTRTTTATPC